MTYPDFHQYNQDLTLPQKEIILLEVQAFLAKIDKPYWPVTLLGTDGSYLVGLHHPISPFLADDEVNMINSCFYTIARAYKMDGEVFIEAISLRTWQINHYRNRLDCATTTEEKSFLRQTLHGLTKRELC